MWRREEKCVIGKDEGIIRLFLFSEIAKCKKEEG